MYCICIYALYIKRIKCFCLTRTNFGSPWGDIILIEKLDMQYKGIKITLRKKEFSHLEK